MYTYTYVYTDGGRENPHSTSLSTRAASQKVKEDQDLALEEQVAVEEEVEAEEKESKFPFLPKQGQIHVKTSRVLLGRSSSVDFSASMSKKSKKY